MMAHECYIEDALGSLFAVINWVDSDYHWYLMDT
jgi:hypothetical protein